MKCSSLRFKQRVLVLAVPNPFLDEDLCILTEDQQFDFKVIGRFRQ